ncbi:hypothetical protein Tco_1323566, partial [Tanacetum coccineum]
RLLKQTDIQDGGEECVMSTQEFITKVANVSVFSPKPSMHYLKITMRNVLWFSIRIELLEVAVCGNVTDQEDQYKLDEEALNLAL